MRITGSSFYHPDLQIEEEEELQTVLSFLFDAHRRFRFLLSSINSSHDSSICQPDTCCIRA